MHFRTTSSPRASVRGSGNLRARISVPPALTQDTQRQEVTAAAAANHPCRAGQGRLLGLKHSVFHTSKCKSLLRGHYTDANPSGRSFMLQVLFELLNLALMCVRSCVFLDHQTK